MQALVAISARQLASKRWGLPMGDVDQLSMMLGSIGSDVKTLFNSLAQHKMDSKAQNDALRDDVKAEISGLRALIVANDAAQQEKNKAFTTDTADWKKWKWAIWGAFLVAALVAGYIGGNTRGAVSSLVGGATVVGAP